MNDNNSIAESIVFTALSMASSLVSDSSSLLKQAFPKNNSVQSSYTKRCECRCQNEYSQYPGRKIIHHC